MMRRCLPLPAAILTLALGGCAGSPPAEKATAGAGEPGATGRQITIEEILAINQAGPPAWSSDGKQLAFVWGPGTERDLWVVDASASRPGRPGDPTLRQVAPLVARGEATVSPDWRRIAYVSKEHIWVLPLGGGRPVRVTAKEGKYSALHWSPDSTRIAFVVTEKDQDDVGVASAAGGEVTMIATRAVDEDSPIWAPSSDRLAFIRRFDNWQGYEIWVSAPDGSGQRPIVKETYDRGVEEFRFAGNRHWSPDGKRIAYLSSRTGYNHVWIASVDGGEPVEITKGPWVDYSPQWAPSGDKIAFVSSRVHDLEDRHIWVISASGGDPVRISPDGFCENSAWSPDGTRIAYLRSSATEPPEVTVQEARPGAAAARLTESRADPSVTANFVEPVAITWPSKDGTRVPGVLLKPRGDVSGTRPALMYFHGKGGINLKGWGGLPNYPFHQYLVQRGYAILFVNWRGTHVGYGAEFERANYRDYAGGELDDVVAGAEYLAREAGVDPERIACWGGSYGGYMTMLAITKAPNVCSAGISLYGVSEWVSFVKQNKRKLWRMRLIAKLGEPDKNPELYNRAAAIRYAAQATSPLLILQGADDDGVVPEQGEALYDAMKKAGKTAEYVVYWGEGHGFRHTGSQRDLYTRAEAFLNKYNVRKAALTE